MFVQTHTRPVDLAREWPVTFEAQRRAPWSKQEREPEEPIVLGPDEETEVEAEPPRG